jgi:hypothetical protein
MTHDDLRLDEQAISKAAEIGLSSQLDEAEKIDVDVRTDLVKAVQGQADSVAIAAEGLVMQKDIRVQEMELHTDSIDINPLSALFGQIELNQPVDATARLVLTEQDINRAFNSDYMRSKLQNLELNVEGKKAIIEPRQLELHLPADGKVVFNVKTLLHDEIGKTKQIGFNATMLVKTGEQSLLMEGFNCTPPGQGISVELAIAFMQKLKELVNLPYIELETMALRVKDVDVQKGSLTLHTEAHVRQIPST